MEKSTRKTSVLIAIIFLWGLCYYFGNIAYSRLADIEERVVILKDVGMTIKSLKNEKYSSFIGFFTDQKTGNTFILDITENEYRDFEKSMYPFETTKLVSADRFENDSAGTVYSLLSMFLGSCALTLIIISLMSLFEKKENNSNIRNRY